MFESRSTGVQPCAGPQAAQLVAPRVAGASCHIPRQGSGFCCIVIEKLSCVHCYRNVRLAPIDRDDPGFHLDVSPGLRIDVEQRRKTPQVLTGIDEPMVLQVVIRVGDKQQLT